MAKLEYPIRINRYLAHQGLSSRRDADKLISAGKVLINGRIAQLGDKVNANDKVEVERKTRQTLAESYVYYAFNKPAGIVTNAEEGQRSVLDFLKGKIRHKVYPLGRLDKESRGLILLTNDGRVTDRLLSPRFNHEKEYLVTVDKKLTPMFQKAITSGVELEDGRTKTAKLSKVDSNSFLLTITEGRKHQIRRMCAALGYQVTDLERVRIMNIELGDLPEKQWRQLAGPELDTFLKDLKLN